MKKLERLEFAVKQIKVLKIKTQELEKDNVDIEKVKAYKNPIELSSSAEILFNTNFLTSTFSKKVKDARELFNSINLNKAWNGSIKDEAIILENAQNMSETEKNF